MNWELLIPLITGVLSGALTGGLALLGVWGSFQRQLGNLEARMTVLERRYEEIQAEYVRLHQEAKAENLRLHEEAKAENLRLHQEMQAEYLGLHQETIRTYEEARAENLRLHEETREQIRREIRLALQVLREHTHADGSPAVTPIPVEADGD